MPTSTVFITSKRFSVITKSSKKSTSIIRVSTPVSCSKTIYANYTLFQGKYTQEQIKKLPISAEISFNLTRSQSNKTIFNPRRANSSAKALPTPSVAPVTTVIIKKFVIIGV